MSEKDRPYPDTISTLEQARQGIITRWNEMRTHDTDVRTLQMKLAAMYAELSFLLRPDEQDIIKEQFKDGKKEGETNPSTAQRMTKVLELLSPIYYERVVSARWDHITGSSQGYGEAAKASQQSLLNIFWSFDILSIQHVYTFVKKLEMILMNEAEYSKVFVDVTHMLERWEYDWGEFPFGAKKAMELPDVRFQKQGPESDFERSYYSRDPDLDRTGISELDFNMHEFRMKGFQYFKEYIDLTQESTPLRVPDESELRGEDAKLKEESYQIIFDAYKKQANLRDLLFGDPLQLIPYRKTQEYQLALRQLHMILMKTMVLLSDCDVKILRDYIPYDEAVQASTSTYRPRKQ